MWSFVIMMTISEYLQHQEANGIKWNAVRNAKISLEQLDAYKPLNQITAPDIPEFINHIREVHGYAEGTLNIRKSYIKSYFRLNGKEDIIKNLKISRKAKELNPDEILVMKDINLLIKNTESPMYKALISVLWECGGRINEVLNIDKEEDLTETIYGFELKLYSSKTADKTGIGFRKMLLPDSTPFIRDWLIFYNKNDNRLFPIRQRNAHEMLGRIGKKAGVRKPVNPHAFRHAAATRLVREKTQESIIRKRMGWSSDSKMISTYIHLNENDVVEDQLKRMGKIKEKEELPQDMTKPVGDSLIDKITLKLNESRESNEQLTTEIEELKAAQKKNEEQTAMILKLINVKSEHPEI